jgi:RNA polymerase-binding transcription factor DksA
VRHEVGKEKLVAREQLPEFKRIGVVGQPCDGRSVPQEGKKSGRENIADVLEEIWRTTDREAANANISRWSGLLQNVRSALLQIKDGAFGACLCCRTTNRG